MSPLRRVLLGGGSGGSGDPFWRPAVNAAIALTNRVSLRLAEIGAGISVSPSPWSQRMTVAPAFSVTESASVTAEKPNVNMALALAPRYESRSTLQTPAFDVQRVQIDLTHRKGGVTATTVGTWTTGTNAQGDHNATLATATGELGAQTKVLTLDYSDLVAKSTLTLSAVRLVYYSRLAGSLLNDTSVSFERSLDDGGSWVTLQTVTADYDEIAAGRTFTLSPLPTLAQIQLIRSRMTVVLPAAGVTKSLAIDAVELEVVGAETWSL